MVLVTRCSIRYPEPYPLYLEPEPFRFKYDHERTKKEAENYYEWLTSNYQERIPTLLSYFYERLTGDAPVDLMRVGAKVANCARLAWCTFMPAESANFKSKGTTVVLPPELELTPAGCSIAIDMGFLLSKLLLEMGCPSIQWNLVTKPKNDINYHSPVIECTQIIRYEPKRVSIASLSHTVREGNNEDAWGQIYDRFKKQCPQ